jgi:hypothetical protein
MLDGFRRGQAAVRSYTAVMASMLDDLRREQLAEHAVLTPAARLQLAEGLGEEAVRLLMAAQGLDRPSAVRLTRATRRTGRRPSRCLDEDP